MAMTTLVTGATGLIGRRVVEELIRTGVNVVGLDRSLDSRLRILPDVVRREVRWVEGDTRDEQKLIAAMRTVDSVIHLAAGASFLMYEEAPLENTAGTIQGFHNLLEAALRSDVDKIVYASTSAVYEGNEVPYRESMDLHPPELKSLSKKVNEEMARVYADRYQLRVLALRPFSVYGETEMQKGKYANVVSLFAWAMSAGNRPRVWGDGSQTRDFIHVSDVARAFTLALQTDTPIRALNVGTGVETSFLELVRLIGSKLGIVPDPVYVPTPIAIYAQRLLADVSLCHETLGFRAEVTLEDGVERVLATARDLRGLGRWNDLDKAHLAFLGQGAT